MSRKMLRRSSMKKSPLIRVSPAGQKNSNAESFLFDSEPVDIPFSSISDMVNKKKSKSKKSKKAIFLLPDPVTSNMSEASESANEEKNIIKKVARKKKIRYTQDLNFVDEENRSDADVKKKTKKTKRARLPSFLPQVDLIDEDKTPHSSAASDSDNKENVISTEDNLNARPGRSRRTRRNKKKSEKNKIIDTKPNSSASSGNISTNESDQREFELSDSMEKGRRGRSSANTKKNISAKRDYDKVADTDIGENVHSSEIYENCTVSIAQENYPDNNKLRPSRSRKTGSLARTSVEKVADIDKGNNVHSSVISEKCTDSISEENIPENMKLRPSRSRRTKTGSLARISVGKVSYEKHEEEPVVQDSTVGTTLSECDALTSPVSKHSIRASLQENHVASKTPKLSREGTFEIISMDPEKIFSVDNMSGFNNVSTRDTYSVVPTPRKRITNSTKKSILTVDLTESPSKKSKRSTFDKNDLANSVADLGQSPKKKLRRSTVDKNSSNQMISSVGISLPSPDKKRSSNDVFIDNKKNSLKKINTTSKDSLDSRKSSFEVSFNFNKKRYSSEDLLDNLNITRRDSSKSYFNKKSTTGFKSSTGSAGEDSKVSFVTLRRQCQTMIDFDIENSLNVPFDNRTKFKNFVQLNEEEMEKKKDKSVCFVDRKSSSDYSKKSPAISKRFSAKKPSPKKGIIKNKSLGRLTRNSKRDTFEMAEAYYESLEGVKLQSIPGLSIIEGTPNKSAQVGAYQDVYDLISNTPTAQLGDLMVGNHESVLVHSFADQTAAVAPRLTRMGTFTIDEETTTKATPSDGRTSMRKRWSQVERTPVFNKNPPVSRNNSQMDASLSTSILTKSVTFPPELDLTPTKPAGNKGKGKKSVKIETPLKTPKIRLHSPLNMRKTPKPNYSLADNSIVSGNCALPKSPFMSPPPSTSTPFAKQKETSLLKRVLVTNEKSKIDKSSCKVKMPNFRKIHERQFEKMENIKELQERKAVRALYLKSGCKIPVNDSESRNFEKDSRKKLLFSPLKIDDSPKLRNATIPKKVSKPMQHMLKKRASLEKKKKEMKTKLPVLLNHMSPLKTTVPKQASVSKVPLQHNMCNKKSPLKIKKQDIKSEPKAVSRFGFKLPTKGQTTKEEQIKAVTTKSKPTVNKTEQHKTQVGAVRMNRRFDLLMQMRAKK